MHVLFIGGVFDVSREPEILKKTRTDVEYAANRLQHKLIKGLREVLSDTCLDAGSRPMYTQARVACPAVREKLTVKTHCMLIKKYILIK